MAWAFAKLGQYHAELFAALARAAQAHLERFSVQGLANTVWAFAKLEVKGAGDRKTVVLGMRVDIGGGRMNK